jgi:hypothetical protein
VLWILCAKFKHQFVEFVKSRRVVAQSRRTESSRKVEIQGLKINTILEHHRVAKMTAKKNKTKVAEEKEAAKEKEAANRVRLKPTLDLLKRGWRARVAAIVARSETEKEKENIRLKKENNDLREKMEEMGRELTAQKFLAANRLTAMKMQEKLKTQAKDIVKEEKGKVLEQKKKVKEGRMSAKSLEEGKKKEKRGRIEAGKKTKEANHKKKEALERAKNAEKSLNELNGQMMKMNEQWSKERTERGPPPTICLPLNNPFGDLEEKHWLKAAIEALPESMRPQMWHLVANGRKRLPPMMKPSEIAAALIGYLYTTHSLYGPYSECYRDPTTSNEAFERVHYMLLLCLKNRKLQPGSYWRGMELDSDCELCLILFAALKANCSGEHTFSLLTPQSASKHINVAAQFGSATGKPGKVQVIFCFESAAVDVKEISAYPWEDECILPPGIVKILSICKVGEKYFCHVAAMYSK